MMYCGATHVQTLALKKQTPHSEQPIVWSAMGLKACDRLLTFTSSSPPPTSLFSPPPQDVTCAAHNQVNVSDSVCPLTKKGEHGKGCDESDREQETCDSVFCILNRMTANVC